MRVRIVLTVSLCLTVYLETAQARQGSWASPYDHPVSNGPVPFSTLQWPQFSVSKFEAINMAVIPLVGTGGLANPGKVVVWDNEQRNNKLGFLSSTSWFQRFSVGSPETGQFDNYILQMPAGLGDLFCSGHVWLPDGRLFVAGGNRQYKDYSVNPPITNYLGSTFAGIWDPTMPTTTQYGWTFLAPMQLNRWYPTVTMLGNNQVMVSGGVEDTDNIECYNTNGGTQDRAADTYELFDIATMNWVPGPVSPGVYEGPQWPEQFDPTAGCTSLFGEYPRQHLLSSGHVFVSGMWVGGNRMHPTQGIWLTNWPNYPSLAGWQNNVLDDGMFRNYGSSVLVPNVGNHPGNVDQVMIIGGSQG